MKLCPNVSVGQALSRVRRTSRHHSLSAFVVTRFVHAVGYGIIDRYLFQPLSAHADHFEQDTTCPSRHVNARAPFFFT